MDQNKNQQGQQKPGQQTQGQGPQKPGQQNPGQNRPAQQNPGQQKPGQQNPGQKPGGPRNLEDEGTEDINRNRDEAEGSRDDISGQGSIKERNQGGISNREFDRDLSEQSKVPSSGSTRSGSER